jgi:xanthine dehydrogenase accessory factor
VSGPVYAALRSALAADRPVALCTVVAGRGVGSKLVVPAEGTPVGDLGDVELDRVVERDARGLLAQGRTEQRHYGPSGEARRDDVTVFVESFAPPPRLVVFGAVDFTRALCKVGKALGYSVTVCDARATFATPARFPEADEVVVDWPDRYLDGTVVDGRTVIAVLTHDPKFDVPALLAAVRTPAVYIGAMGSRRTHADRVERLRDAGMTDADLARISAPIGLDIGARTPEETAISILAEVVAIRTGRDGGRLTGGSSPIHAR